MPAYDHAFAPLRVGSRTVKNRIVSTAHATGYGRDGVITEDYLEYHARKAAGGLGLTMTFGSASVHRNSAASYGSISLWDPRNEQMLRRLAERVHEHDVLVMSQASHLGRRGTSHASGIPLGAPSDVPEPVHREIPHVLTEVEIADIVAAFADAARRLARCGWDGIEVTSFGGHLIEQFWSPLLNRRDDRYGGSFDNRMRFAEEVVHAVADHVPDDFLLGIRLSGDPGRDVVGLGPEDMCAIAARLDALGRVDVINVSGSTGATLESQAGTIPPDSYPTPVYNHLARRIRETVSVPVLAAGRNLDLDVAEQAIARGDADLIAMTRALIADPDLPRHGQHGQPERARPCIAINDACIGRLYTGLSIRCAVNPAVGYPHLADHAAAATARTVVVVGAGPAGLEAARVAATRGHRVVLLEARDVVGGQIATARRDPRRPHLGRHIDWLAAELPRLEVDLRLGVDATAGTVYDLAPDAVIVATGATSVVPDEVADVSAPAVTDEDLLRDLTGPVAGKRVLVYDREGQIRGGYAALRAAALGAARVELATPLQSVCAELDPTQLPGMRRALARHRVHCSPDQELLPSQSGCPVLRDVWSGATRRPPADLTVFVGFRRARSYLGHAVPKTLPGVDVRCIGDCLAPRRLYDATREGAATAATV